MPPTSGLGHISKLDGDLKDVGDGIVNYEESIMDHEKGEEYCCSH